MHTHPVLPGTIHPSTQSVPCPPRIVLALEGLANAAELKSLFQAHGFDVRVAKTAAEARDLARAGQTVASLIAAESNKLESGWLTCKKLLLERPNLRVVLIGHRPSARSERFAHFLGASAYVSTSSSPQSIARAALGTELPSIN